VYLVLKRKGLAAQGEGWVLRDEGKQFAEGAIFVTGALRRAPGVGVEQGG